MVVVPAFAKLNLALKVLYRRDDGYHEISTVFQSISLADSLEIEAEEASSTLVECDCSVHFDGPNLAATAAELVLAELNQKAHVRIRIDKKIPIGGGLGGGSSDAASVILALPALLGRCLSEEQSLGLAARLGSDLPYFLLGGCARASGRGEVLERLPDPALLHGILVSPGVSVSTPAAYAALGRPNRLDLTGLEQEEIMRKFRELLDCIEEQRSANAWRDLCENDFEPVVFTQHPLLALWLDRIRATEPLLARMSGSGSTLFALFSGEDAAHAAAEELKVDISGHATGIRVELLQTIDRRHYERAWHTALSSFTDGASWPPRSLLV